MNRLNTESRDGINDCQVVLIECSSTFPVLSLEPSNSPVQVSPLLPPSGGIVSSVCALHGLVSLDALILHPANDQPQGRVSDGNVSIPSIMEAWNDCNWQNKLIKYPIMPHQITLFLKCRVRDNWHRPQSYLRGQISVYVYLHRVEYNWQSLVQHRSNLYSYAGVCMDACVSVLLPWQHI